MSLSTEEWMAKKFDWERATITRKARYGLSVKDEEEFRQRDLAARWLQRAEHKQDKKAATKRKK